MIKNRDYLKRSLPQNRLIVSDQILVSAFDAIVAIVLLFLGLAMIIGDRTKIIMIVGITLITLSGIYALLKNVFLRSFGCILTKSCYVQEQSNAIIVLRLAILIHNIISISPLIGLVIYRKFPYALYLIILVYLLNFVGYKTDSKRIIDSWLHLSVVREERFNILKILRQNRINKKMHS